MVIYLFRFTELTRHLFFPFCCFGRFSGWLDGGGSDKPLSSVWHGCSCLLEFNDVPVHAIPSHAHYANARKHLLFSQTHSNTFVYVSQNAPHVRATAGLYPRPCRSRPSRHRRRRLASQTQECMRLTAHPPASTRQANVQKLLAANEGTARPTQANCGRSPAAERRKGACNLGGAAARTVSVSWGRSGRRRQQ